MPIQTREKIVLCVVPYLLGGYLWVSVTSPVFTERQEKDTQLNKKRHEQIELETKLHDITRLQKEKGELERSIQSLRSSVPKSPDTDVLLIDLENMAAVSGVDLVAIEPPEKDELKQMEEVTSTPAKGGPSEVKKEEKPAMSAAPAMGKTKQPTAEEESGLSKEVLLVKVTGDYPSFIEFMRRLESYQRVIGITRVEAKLPAATGDKKVQDPKLLQIAFFMTAYYLP